MDLESFKEGRFELHLGNSISPIIIIQRLTLVGKCLTDN